MVVVVVVGVCGQYEGGLRSSLSPGVLTILSVLSVSTFRSGNSASTALRNSSTVAGTLLTCSVLTDLVPSLRSTVMVAAMSGILLVGVGGCDGGQWRED